MDRLISILRAAHCRSTHHFFVIDAIPMVQSQQGRRLCSQLLNHHQQYLTGAKAPDKEFRDFRNHVIHVNDNHWGGAAKLADEWYHHCIRKIRQGRWSETAYCAGVLSHYVTDPLMPLHTAQSPRESIAHRALEWSVTKSYDRILNRYREGGHQIVFDLSGEVDWIGPAVTKGAELANRHYDELLDRYDLQRGSRRPEEGFDDASIDILAGLFGVALTGWARIIERIAEDARIEIPEAPLTLASLIAGINMPVAWIVRRIESTVEQKAVRAIFHEYQTTGTVVEHLPPEVSTVQRDRARDQLASHEVDSTREPTRSTEPSPKTTNDSAGDPEPSRSRLPMTSRPPETSRSEPNPRSTARFGLALSDDLVDAPSIGPKTAKRFAKIGITTVEQFLAASASELEKQLATRWIKEETLCDWQDQARLVVTVPGLCGYKAQLLVGVDCRDRDALAAQSAASLHHQVDMFASTTAGKRALRSSRVPTREEIADWIAAAGSDTLIKRSA